MAGEMAGGNGGPGEMGPPSYLRFGDSPGAQLLKVNEDKAM
jgi:hypothetical protein